MGEMPLREAFDEYQNVYMPSRNFAGRTRIEYSNDLMDLVLFLERNGLKKVGDIELPDIERYLAELDKRGIAGATRKRKVVSIRSFLFFLYQDGFISNNLSKRIIPPLVEIKNPRYLTQREYTRLLEACAGNPRDFAIIQLLLQTGIKLSELVRITINDIELPDEIFPNMKNPGYLHVSGNERQKERVIPLNYKPCLAIHNYLGKRPYSISPVCFINRFGQRLSPRGVEKALSKYFDQARIAGANVQSLRHTFGTNQAVKGTSLETLQALMGHKDRRSTSVYTELAKETANQIL